MELTPENVDLVVASLPTGVAFHRVAKTANKSGYRVTLVVKNQQRVTVNWQRQIKARCARRDRPAETAFFEELTVDGWVSRFARKQAAAAAEDEAQKKRKLGETAAPLGEPEQQQKIKRVARNAAIAGVAARREAEKQVISQGGSRPNSGRRKGCCGPALTATLRERLLAKTGKSAEHLSARQIELALGMSEDMDRKALEERVRTLRGKGGLDQAAVRAKARAQLAAEKRREKAAEIENKHREWAEPYLSRARRALGRTRTQKKTEQDEEEFGEELCFKGDVSPYQVLKLLDQIYALKTLYLKLREGANRDECFAAAASHAQVSVHTVKQWDADFRTNRSLKFSRQGRTERRSIFEDKRYELLALEWIRVCGRQPSPDGIDSDFMTWCNRVLMPLVTAEASDGHDPFRGLAFKKTVVSTPGGDIIRRYISKTTARKWLHKLGCVPSKAEGDS